MYFITTIMHAILRMAKSMAGFVSGNREELQYLNLLRDLRDDGVARLDRTGVGTRSLFCTTMRFSLLRDRFPLLTTKAVFYRGVVEELLWFIRGGTNSKDLESKGVNIWKAWGLSAEAAARSGLPEGSLGPVYGEQWRRWTGADGQTVDQLAELITNLRERPFSRRHVLTAWNPSVLPQEGVSHDENIVAGRQVLPACHTLVGFNVRPLKLSERLLEAITNGISITDTPKLGLSCVLVARSQDTVLGTPFNIASYALLTKIIAKVVGMTPVEYVHIGLDTHLYSNHHDAVAEQLKRSPRAFPTLKLRESITDIDGLSIEDFVLEGYNPHPSIKAPVAV